MAKLGRRVAKKVLKGGPGGKKTVTPARAAQIHRWQMLGAAARRGQKKAQRKGHHNAVAANRKGVASTYASAAKWGAAKVILPTSLVTPILPGYQPGDRVSSKPKRRKG